MIDLELDRYKTSEKVLINRNLENVWKLDYLNDLEKIFVFDRGFPSIEFFIKLTENDAKFLCRLKKVSYKQEKSEMRTDDEFVDIDITKLRVNHLKSPEMKEEFLKIGNINLRITKIKLDNDEEEHLISNLEKDEFSHEDLKELYNLRWGIEVCYDILKNYLDIENISGYKEIAIEQDFLSQMLAYNIITDVENTTQKKFDKREDKKENKSTIPQKD